MVLILRGFITICAQARLLGEFTLSVSPHASLWYSDQPYTKNTTIEIEYKFPLTIAYERYLIFLLEV